MNSFSRLFAVLCLGACCSLARSESLPSIAEAAASKLDVYTEAALKQPNGPSYEFFRPLILPLRYVNTDFAVYPIVLSAPRAPVKARLVANGSAINARANTRVWFETGVPMLIRVGNDELAFGHYPQRLEGPKLLNGCLPVVAFRYDHAGGEYEQEVFASVGESYSSNGVVLAQFNFRSTSAERESGRLAIRVDSDTKLTSGKNRVLNEQGKTILWHDPAWKWDPKRKVLEIEFVKSGSAVIAVASVPMDGDSRSPLDDGGFEHEKRNCISTWEKLLSDGMRLDIPEDYVQNAWRTMLLANFSLIRNDSMLYSAGNHYEKLYEQEGSQAAQALMQFGYEEEMRRLIVPLLDFTRKGVEYHQAGHKLDNVCRYFWQTRDAEFVKELRPRWQREVDRLANHRSTENGLFPREQYCGDITNAVFSMNSNAKGWRALRDTAKLLEAIGDSGEAGRISRVEKEFQKDILAALDKSVSKNTQDTFVPIALFGEEQPYDVITGSKMGSYWNLMANNVLGTEIFGCGDILETGMLRYFQEHGGLFMGLTRSRPWPSFWISSANLNPLYGWPYVRTLLRRDDPDRALASFYGMLAAGLTPDTFTCGEGCAIQPVDALGRQFYSPPNSAGNALWLHTLRNLLVQDWDLTEDGEPETLRLMFATPRNWLDHGKRIEVIGAPTAFGPVSIQVESRVKAGAVVFHLDLPVRSKPAQILLRARVPAGYAVTGATSQSEALKTDYLGTVDITRLSGKHTIGFKVRPR